jgi:CheY-like chemotaxis protein
MTLRTVLLVDDDPAVRRVAELSLTRVGGFVVRSVGSGAEALAAAQREPFDVILLDVMMEGMDGPQVLAALRADARSRGVPVVFLTARAHGDELARLRALGAHGALRKPFDPMTLPTQLRALLGDPPR